MQERNTWPGWECVRQIGTGSFGKVYEIQREEFGSVYKAALTVITVPQSQTEVQNVYNEGMDEQSATRYFRAMVEEITHEFALMSQVKGHSNIVSYEDHMVIEHEGEIGWDILIRMELLTPLPLWNKEHPLSEKEVIRLGCDICRGLELCQMKNMIHRDVKPENIFVNSYNAYKLGDFGIARTAEKTMANLSKKGTYSYMAPEIYLGKAYNSTVDIYSLGTVLYRFLNENRVPFLPLGEIRYSDREEALSKRMSGLPVPPPVHGSEKLKEVVLKAIAFDSKERYQTATDFLRALEGCLANENVQSVLQETTPKEKTEVLSKADKGMSQEVSEEFAIVETEQTSEPLPQQEDSVEENTGTLLLAHSDVANNHDGEPEQTPPPIVQSFESQPMIPAAEKEKEPKAKSKKKWIIAAASIVFGVLIAVIALVTWRNLPEVGTNIETSTAHYKITSKGREVCYQKPLKKTYSEISIPDKIKYKGVYYKVTSIANRACEYNENLTKLCIGKNVESIGGSAFANCKNLHVIYVYTDKLTEDSVYQDAFLTRQRFVTRVYVSAKDKKTLGVLSSKGLKAGRKFTW